MKLSFAPRVLRVPYGWGWAESAHRLWLPSTGYRSKVGWQGGAVPRCKGPLNSRQLRQTPWRLRMSDAARVWGRASCVPSHPNRPGIKKRLSELLYALTGLICLCLSINKHTRSHLGVCTRSFTERYSSADTTNLITVTSSSSL